MPVKRNLINMHFGRLTVTSEAQTVRTKSGRAIRCYNCICECGKEVIVRGQALTSGNTKSCGCLEKEKLSQEHPERRKLQSVELINDYAVIKAKEDILIDIEDVEKISKYRWWIDNSGYPRTKIHGQNIRMHVFITGKKNLDHINRNKLDNRRSNLRECTNEQNMANRRKPINKTNKYIGVYKDKRRNNSKYEARCGNVYLGMFNTAAEAAKARDRAAVAKYGEFATLNFKEGEKYDG